MIWNSPFFSLRRFFCGNIRRVILWRFCVRLRIPIMNKIINVLNKHTLCNENFIIFPFISIVNLLNGVINHFEQIQHEYLIADFQVVQKKSV